MAEGSSETRRRFLKTATAALGGAIGAVLAIPLVRNFLYPVGKNVVSSAVEPVDVAAAGSLVAGASPVQVPILAAQQRDAWIAREKVAVGSVWLQKQGDGTITALSAACPHLGCAIGYDEGAELFRCPCHKSAFRHDGARTEGPAKRGLDPLPVEVVDGRVKVTYLRFRPDVAEREPV